MYTQTQSLSEMFTEDVSEKGKKQCLLAFKALHSHPLQTVVVLQKNQILTSSCISLCFSFSTLAISVFYLSSHILVLLMLAALCSESHRCMKGKQHMVQIWTFLHEFEIVRKLHIKDRKWMTRCVTCPKTRHVCALWSIFDELLDFSISDV